MNAFDKKNFIFSFIAEFWGYYGLYKFLSLSTGKRVVYAVNPKRSGKQNKANHTILNNGFIQTADDCPYESAIVSIFDKEMLAKDPKARIQIIMSFKKRTTLEDRFVNFGISVIYAARERTPERRKGDLWTIHF